MTSANNVLVNGMSCYILDNDPVIIPGSLCPSGGSEEDNACDWEGDGMVSC